MKSNFNVCTLSAFTAAALPLMQVEEVFTPQKVPVSQSSETYQKIPQYQILHRENDQYGPGAVRLWPLIRLFIDYLRPKSILDFGCGKGMLVETMGKVMSKIRVAGYDPAVPGYDKLLMKQADMIVCTDVLEHIPEEDLYVTLESISAISSRVFFSLHHAPASAILPNGENAHCTVKSVTWYYAMLRKHFEHVTCLPVSNINSIALTFPITCEVQDAYMSLIDTGLIIV